MADSDSSWDGSVTELSSDEEGREEYFATRAEYREMRDAMIAQNRVFAKYLYDLRKHEWSCVTARHPDLARDVDRWPFELRQAVIFAIRKDPRRVLEGFGYKLHSSQKYFFFALDPRSAYHSIHVDREIELTRLHLHLLVHVLLYYVFPEQDRQRASAYHASQAAARARKRERMLINPKSRKR